MKSPFPGMDPYLEQHWPDVHHRLVTYACDQIQPRLPADLRPRVEERVFVESPEAEVRTVYPDVHVAEHPSPRESGAVAVEELTITEPLVVRVPDEPKPQGYVEIVDAASGNRVITLIEFLSPANKLPGEGRELYLRKQREARMADVSLVEVDLTRAGDRGLSCPQDWIPPSHRTTYQICVARAWKIGQYEVYPAPLAERLPVIGIPLRKTDADVPLDLQALIDLCYQNGRYDDLDYKAEPNPPLDPADAAWADQHLRSTARR